MPIIQRPIAEATPEEMLSFATNFLSLELDGGESEEQINAKIAQAQPGTDFIFVEDNPPTEAIFNDPTPQMLSGQDTNARVEGGLGRGDPRVKIFIPVVETNDGTGAADVGVGVNGRVWQLKRGMDLIVPWRVVEALGLCEQDLVRHDFDKDEVIVTKSMRFPIQFPEGRPPIDVIRKWHEDTDKAFCP